MHCLVIRKIRTLSFFVWKEVGYLIVLWLWTLSIAKQWTLMPWYRKLSQLELPCLVLHAGPSESVINLHYVAISFRVSWIEEQEVSIVSKHAPCFVSGAEPARFFSSCTCWPLWYKPVLGVNFFHRILLSVSFEERIKMNCTNYLSVLCNITCCRTAIDETVTIFKKLSI